MFPPKATLASCMPRQMPNTGFFRRHAALDHLDFKHILIHIKMAHAAHRILPVQMGRNIPAAGAEKAVNGVNVLRNQFRVIGH